MITALFFSYGLTLIILGSVRNKSRLVLFTGDLICVALVITISIWALTEARLF
jgi:hypothetical protein